MNTFAWKKYVTRILSVFGLETSTTILRPVPVKVRNRASSKVGKLFVVALLLGSAANDAAAQRFGFRGGVERTQLVNDVSNNAIGTETGFTLGAFVNIPLPKHFGLALEGVYSQKVVTQQNLELAQTGVFEPNASLHLGYIQMPLMVTYTLPVPGPLKPRLFGGPVIGVVVDESVDLKGKQAGDIANEAALLTKEAFADREIGWTAGAGASLGFRGFPIMLILDMRYTGGVASIQDDFAGNPLSRQLEIGAFSGSVGIAF